MNTSSPLSFSPNILVRRGLAACIVALLIGVIVMLVVEVRHQLELLDASAAENVQWTLGQAETEILALELAIARAESAPEDTAQLQRVRLRFDIAYSRIDTLLRAEALVQLRTIDGTDMQLTNAMAFRDAWVPIIDGPDDELRAAMADLSAHSASLRRDLRGLALEGVALFAQLGDARRVEISRTLTSIGMMTIALVGVLTILIFAVLRLARQRQREAKANRETRERMETIISTSLDAVVVVDRTNRIVDWNGAAERVFGYTRAEAIGADMPALIIPRDFREMHRLAMTTYLETGAGRVVGRGIVQLEARRRDGTSFPVDLSVDRAHSPRGEIFVAFIRDISDRVRAEQAIKRARDRAVAGEKQKAELLAVMSHEMRTPLNGILGSIDLFHGEELDNDNQRYLRIIRQSGEVLLGHVNDVLDISRLDAGKMTMRKQRFDLVDLLEEIVETQGPRARDRGNTLLLAPPSPELHAVYSDPDRLRQILLNLVSNAIKFTWNGKIILEAECSEGLDAVNIRVTDTGVGIAAEDLERIFEDFVTIDSTYGRRNHGTGLGLGISQRLAAALGGELGAESEPGDGSVFWLSLPMAAPAGAPLADPPPPRDHAEPRNASLPALDVLLVEDNAINREVAQRMLTRDGHTTSLAENGERGVALARDRAFDVILMDISMPGMDGITAARVIRRSGGPNVDTPIIAATAHALPDEVRAFHAAGMTTVLTKPINGAALRHALAEALSQRAEDTLSQGTVVPSASAASSDAVIDQAHLDELREDLDPDRLHDAFTRFEAEIDAFFEALPTALEQEEPDIAALASEAHRLAGSAGVFGALPLAARLRGFEVQARNDGEDADALLPLAEPLEALWARTYAELAAQGLAPIKSDS